MKQVILGILLCIVSVQLLHAQAKLPNSATTNTTKKEQELLDLSKTKWTWMADKNVAALNGLFAENCVFVHMGGSWGKNQELNTIKGGMIWYKKAAVYGASVNIFGNTAILLNDIDLLAVVGGNEVTHAFMVTEVYIKEADKWKLGSLTFSTLLRPVKMNNNAQHSLEKIWESDSLAINNPESVLYDATSNSLYVSSMGSGSVVRLDTNGKVIQKDLMTGLNSNKGSALFNGLLYTAETSAIAVIDVNKGTIIKRIPVEGAQMLNDVAMDSKGIIYVSDTRSGKVYRIEGDKPGIYLENMPGANGLLSVNADLYVLTSTSFQKVDANKVITKIAEGFETGLDGIVMIGENEFIISNYQGMLYYVKADGTKQLLLDTRANRIMSNDISYNSKTKTLYVPSFSTNRIIAYKVN
jgi:DNA-binding beta-propeller fold protein YncE